MSDSYQRYYRNTEDGSSPSESKLPNSLVNASMKWLQAINDVYGGDRGMEIWQKMSAEVSPDLQIAVFRAMLSGDDGNTCEVGIYGLHGGCPIPSPAPGVVGSIKVNRIKAIRSVSDLGLRESKFICEEVEAGHAIQFTANYSMRDGSIIGEADILEQLNAVGFIAEIR